MWGGAHPLDKQPCDSKRCPLKSSVTQRRCAIVELGDQCSDVWTVGRKQCVCHHSITSSKPNGQPCHERDGDVVLCSRYACHHTVLTAAVVLACSATGWYFGRAPFSVTALAGLHPFFTKLLLFRNIVSTRICALSQPCESRALCRTTAPEVGKISFDVYDLQRAENARVEEKAPRDTAPEGQGRGRQRDF